MKILNDVTQILTVIASLTPFIGVGYYFGRLEKRIKTVEQKIQKHSLILLKKTE